MSTRFVMDAQLALSFLIQQATHLETEVNKIEYPEIQYPQLVPVDTSANEWARSITFFSMDRVGAAQWFQAAATDMALADVARTKHEHAIEMAGIGYRYNLEELGAAMLVPGTNLSTERADAARLASEEFIDDIAIRGDSAKSMTGLINDANVTVVMAINDGTGASPDWTDKTGDQIARDVNNLLSGIYQTTRQVEIADTLLLPVESAVILATKRMDTQGGSISVMEWLQKYNVFTAQTGQPLTVRAVRGLETAGTGSAGRAVAYRRDPRVLKLHLPMPHRFLPVWQTGPLTFDVPGIFRLGGVEVRRPGAMRYLDGIVDTVYQ